MSVVASSHGTTVVVKSNRVAARGSVTVKVGCDYLLTKGEPVTSCPLPRWMSDCIEMQFKNRFDDINNSIADLYRSIADLKSWVADYVDESIYIGNQNLFQSIISIVNEKTGDNASAIITLEAKVDDNHAEAIYRLELQSQYANSIATALDEFKTYSAENYALSSHLTVLEANVNGLSQGLADTNANVTNLDQALATADSAWASSSQSLQAQYEDLETSINARIDSQSEVFAGKFPTVKGTIDPNQACVDEDGNPCPVGTIGKNYINVQVPQNPDGTGGGIIQKEVYYQWMGSGFGWQPYAYDPETVGWAASASKLIIGPDGKVTGWSMMDGSGNKSRFDIRADNITFGSGNSDTLTVSGGRVVIGGSTQGKWLGKLSYFPSGVAGDEFYHTGYEIIYQHNGTTWVSTKGKDGSDGEDGVRGPASMTKDGCNEDDISQAASDFASLVDAYYKNGDSISYTGSYATNCSSTTFVYYNGWQKNSLYVDGNAIINGTLSVDKIRSDSLTKAGVYNVAFRVDGPHTNSNTIHFTISGLSIPRQSVMIITMSSGPIVEYTTSNNTVSKLIIRILNDDRGIYYRSDGGTDADGIRAYPPVIESNIVGPYSGSVSVGFTATIDNEGSVIVNDNIGITIIPLQ